jgi:hypothetical protein
MKLNEKGISPLKGPVTRPEIQRKLHTSLVVRERENDVGGNASK